MGDVTPVLGPCRICGDPRGCNPDGICPSRHIWMVERVAAFGSHWSDPPATFGPFETRQEAEAFVDSPYGGVVYDASAR